MKVQPIFPPRPKSKITPANLPVYESSGKWCVQRKFNGQRTIIHVSEDRTISIFGRECEEHGNFIPTQNLITQLQQLDYQPGKSYWLDGELLHAKTTTPEYKNKIILFDVLQEGNYFFQRTTLLERYDVLKRICRNPLTLEPKNGIALFVTPNVWMAETFFDNFSQHFHEKKHLDEIEGLVVKKRDSVLDSTGHRYYESTWLIRCRKPTKNYNH